MLTLAAAAMGAVAYATSHAPEVNIEQSEDGLWVLGAAIIAARECLEAVVIFSAYDTAVARHFEQNKGSIEEHSPRQYRQAMVVWSALAVVIAIAAVAGAGAGLVAAGSELDSASVEIFEGVSKIVAALCVGLLFLKIDKLMSKTKDLHLSSPHALGLTVFWNVVREMAEIGFFLVPYFLGKSASGAGLAFSCVVGAFIGTGAGAALVIYGRRLTTAGSARVYFKNITLFLSAGLFMGGCHEIEEVTTESAVFFDVDQKKFPMALLRPFGYTDKYTHVEFWCLAVAFATLIFLDKFRARRAAEKGESRRESTSGEMRSDVVDA